MKLEDLDFSDVKNHLEKLKEIKKARPAEVKKKEKEEEKKSGWSDL